jgi:hypothetical protein
MSQDLFPTKWKFIVDFEDEDTREVSGTIGQSDTQEECEHLLECDIEYHHSHGRIVLNAEAVEVCANCEGEGKISTANAHPDICQVCGGQLGPLANLTMAGNTFLLIRHANFSRTVLPRRAA